MDFVASSLRKNAQQEAQFHNYAKAELFIKEFLETPGLSTLNQHMGYNDLIFYTYKQFNTDPDSVKRCIEYCEQHIELLPKLIVDFSSIEYDFEKEYVLSVEMGLVLLEATEDKEGLVKFSEKLTSYYTSSTIKNRFSTLAYQVIHNEYEFKATVDDANRVFREHLKFIQVKKEMQEKATEIQKREQKLSEKSIWQRLFNK